MQDMLSGKRAIVHGGSGAIGGAVARALARHGADIFLTGRNLAKLERVSQTIAAAGGRSQHAVVDVLDPVSVEAHADAVAKHGPIDILVNAVGIEHLQGPGIDALTLEEFERPIAFFTRANFNAAKAATRFMSEQGRGVVITFSPPGSRLPGRGYIGHGAAFAAVVAFSRLLAVELGARGVRSVCVQPHAVPEALEYESHAGPVFDRVAASLNTTRARLVDELMPSSTLLGRLPTLAQVAETVAFLASPFGEATTGAVINLTCGALVD